MADALLLETGDRLLLEDGSLLLLETPVTTSYLLLENGDRLLLEDGSFLILDDTGVITPPAPVLTLSPPLRAHGLFNVPSLAFSVALTNPAAGDTTVTFQHSGLGAWSPASVTLNSATPSASSVFTPLAYGSFMVWVTGDNGAAASAHLTYVSDGLQYFIAASGSDSNDGQSTLTPWQTWERIESYGYYRDGTYAFNGADTFDNVALHVHDNNDGQTQTITFTSYGTGNATLRNTGSTTHSIIRASNCGGVIVDHLTLVGAGTTPAATTQAVVYFDVNQGNVLPNLYNVRVQYCDISRGQLGIWLFPYVGHQLAFPIIDGIYYGHNTIHNCWNAGIISRVGGGIDDGFLLNEIFEYNTIENIDTTNQAYGIVWGACTDALIRYNLIRNIGSATCNSSGAMFCAGQTNATLVQWNEIYNIRTNSSTAFDAYGINLDYGTHNCIVEHNYIHGCDLSGLACIDYKAGDASRPALAGAWDNNTFRYNIVQKTGVFKGGAFSIAGEALSNIYLYNNTIEHESLAAGYGLLHAEPSTATIPATNITGLHIYNNVLYGSTSNVVLINFPSTMGNQNQVFPLNNAYWPVSGTNQIRWFGTNYSTVAAWVAAATNKDVGAVTSNPLLTDPTNVINVGNPALLASSVTLVDPVPGSPLINAGLNLTVAPYSYTGITVDFHDHAVPVGAFDIGAVEVQSGAVPTPYYFMQRRRLG